jgi:hypothetical protein
LDWEYVIEKALAHRVMPLLFRSLYASCQDSVPQAAFGRLRELYRANAQRNLLLTGELLKLLNLLDTHRISAIPFKGPVLTVVGYKNLSLRQFSDLDILVRREDVVRAKDLLISEGYRPWRSMTQTQETFHLRSYHAFVFLPKSETYSVDLHWAITRSDHCFPVRMEYLWENLQWMSFAGARFRTLSVEDLMLVLCLHGSKHGWTRLQWICDIAELVHSHPALDWAQVMLKARDLSIHKALFIPLLLARNLVGASIPDDVLAGIKTDPKLEAVAQLVTQRLFFDQSFLARRCHDLLLAIRMRERTRDGFLYLLYQLRLMLTPNEMDHAVIVLPTALSFLYYIMRPIRLIMTYALLPLVRPSKVKNPG